MTRRPIHAGIFLQDELAELGISAAGLVRRIGMSASRVRRILTGKARLTAEAALRLGRWLGTGPGIWLNLQKAYELDLARREMGSALDAIEPRIAA